MGDQSLEGRELIALSALEVTRDIMDLEFVLKSNEDPESIEFFLEVTNWTSEFIEVYLNFTNPLLISKGQEHDMLVCKILNKELFRARFSNDVLMNDRIYLQKNLPRQLPRGVDEGQLLT
jgi:hypothetical protein